MNTHHAVLGGSTLGGDEWHEEGIERDTDDQALEVEVQEQIIAIVTVHDVISDRA